MTGGYRAYGKRIFDLLLTIPSILLLVIIAIPLALLVWYRLGSPILFRQQRPGYLGQPFAILKFRTMTDERDAEGNLLPDEQRLTPFGQFLRRFSLDELPELINVVKGEMSLVGPRPLLMEYLDRYTPEQMRRHDVLPGLTGWAQVKGRNALSWEEKFAYDLWYVDHQTMWLDIKIILLTLIQIIKQDGISAEGYATMPVFMGTQQDERG